MVSASHPMPGCWLVGELDAGPGLTDTGADMLADAGTGKNGGPVREVCKAKARASGEGFAPHWSAGFAMRTRYSVADIGAAGHAFNAQNRGNTPTCAIG
jgi:hypothetical protein